MLDEPVVQGPMVLEFKRAEGMGDVLDGVGLAVGKVIAWINAPGRARARMARVQNAIEHRVAQIDVSRCHVDLRSQHPRPVGELARPHAPEKVEVFLDASLTPRTIVPGFCQRAAARPHLLLRLIIDIGLAVTDQVLGPRVELLEIVRCVVKVRSPVEAEPAYILLDRIDKLLLLFGRIGVIETQVTAAAEFLRDAEIEANRLGVTDVQIPVWLRRKSGHHGAMAFRGEIIGDDIADEIAPHLCGRGSGVRHASSILLSRQRLCAKSARTRQDHRPAKPLMTYAISMLHGAG